MQIRFAKNVFLYWVVISFFGCTSESTPKDANVFKSQEQEFIELNRFVLELPPFERIDSKGVVKYRANNKNKIDKHYIDLAVSKMNILGVSKVKVIRGLFGEKGVYVTYEINRQGWLNPKITSIVFSDPSEDVERLSTVAGCSKYSFIQDFWYVKVLYDDGVC